jgi:hypothetical protein
MDEVYVQKASLMASLYNHIQMAYIFASAIGGSRVLLVVHL